MPDGGFSELRAREFARTPKIEQKEAPPESRLDKLHAAAVAGKRLESLLPAGDRSELDAYLASTDLSSKARERFALIAEKYFRLEERADALENLAGTPSAEDFGYDMFVMRTGKPPKGKVTFERREAYFVMVCSQKEDYASAYKGLGQHKQFNSSSGTYHRSMTFTYAPANIEAQVLLVNGKADTDSVVIHERQHFINHELLGNFHATERRSETVEQMYEDAHARAIKDEVLAYIRDGSNGYTIVKTLQESTYKHLALRPDDVRQLSAFCDELDGALMDTFYDRGSRAILVYQLASVPFAQFPDAMKEITAYYKERVKSAESQLSYDEVPDGTAIYPPSCRKIAKDVDDTYTEYLSLLRETKRQALGLTDRAVSSAQLSVQRSRITKQADFLRSRHRDLLRVATLDGAHVPVARITYPHAERTSEAWVTATKHAIDQAFLSAEHIEQRDINDAFLTPEKIAEVASLLAQQLERDTGVPHTVEFSAKYFEPEERLQFIVTQGRMVSGYPVSFLIEFSAAK